MNFKTFFLLIIITLSSNSYSQWWQSGGNLIWPYGDVEIVSGDLSVQSYSLMPYSKVIWLEFRTDVVSEYDYYQYVSILKTIGFDNYDDSTNWVDTITSGLNLFFLIFSAIFISFLPMPLCWKLSFDFFPICTASEYI